MRVVHLEVRNNDGHRQSHGEDSSQGAQGSDKHSQVGLGHHVPVADRRHGDEGPPKAQRDAVEVVLLDEINFLEHSNSTRTYI